MPAPKKPTMYISVKQPDGTIKKVPVGEFKKQFTPKTKQVKQTPPPTPVPAPVVKKVEEQVVSAPAPIVNDPPPTPEPPKPTPPPTPKVVRKVSVGDVKKTPTDIIADTSVHALSTTAPVTDIFIDEAMSKAHHWDVDDHKSPLEVDLHKDESSVHKDLPSIPHGRDGVLDEVINDLSFTINEDLHPRLRSLIQSRLKGIRKDEQIVGYAKKGTDQGGLGLGDEQSEELLNAILDALHLEHSAPESKPLPHLTDNSRSATVDKVPLAEPIKKVPQKKKIISTQPKPAGKPVMHDVRPPIAPKVPTYKPPSVEEKAKEAKVESIGPVDEMKMFTITDLHRLGSTPAEQEKVLKQKFDILKQESFFLYINAVTAWFQSPIYKMYSDVLKESINQQKTMAEITGKHKSDGISILDVMTVVEINKHIK